MSLQNLRGDATDPIGDGPRIIAHCCNDIGGWGRGFVVALSRRWEAPERRYREWYLNGQSYEVFRLQETSGVPVQFKLGAVQFVEVGENLFVANIIGQHGVTHQDGRPPIRYPAIQRGLQRVKEFAEEIEASVHMPRMGAGLAGGAWASIEDIVLKCLANRGIEVFVYDLIE